MDSEKSTNDIRKIFEADSAQLKAKEEIKRVDEINTRVEAEAKATGGLGNTKE